MLSVRNEKIRLFATDLATMAAGCFVAGFVAPLIALVTAHAAPLPLTVAVALTFVAPPPHAGAASTSLKRTLSRPP